MQRKNLFAKIAILAAATTVLSACSTFFPNTDASPNPKAEERYAQLMRGLQEARAEQIQARSFYASTPWLVGKEVVEPERYPELEDKWITIGEFNKTLPAIVPRLSRLGGVAINLAPDLYEKEDNANGGAAANNAVGMDSTGGSALSLLTNSATGSSSDDEVLKKRIFLEVDGPFTEALDSISAQLGISWEFDTARNKVTFYRLTTETLQVFFPGESTTTIGTGGSGDSADNVISQQSKFEFEGGTWEEVAEGINALLSPWGKSTVVKSTGNVVVKDTPDAVRRVSKYVESINDIYGRQVYLEIKTASVTMEDTNEFNLAWKDILNAVNGGAFNLGLDSPGMPVGASAANLNVIRASNGASLALQLLATKAESTETNDQAVTTLSNQPASLKVLTENGYIKSISQQAGAAEAENIVSEVDTDTIQTGFDATLIPRVVNKNSIQLQVAMELSGNLTLLNFDTTIVQTPVRDRNSVVQRAWLKSGETWVIAAFNSDKSQREERGAGSSAFWGLGGGKTDNKSGQILLVMVTPHIQDGAYKR
jgi:type IVB pilus formation R64 PilN family outer membrane protein